MPLLPMQGRDDPEDDPDHDNSDLMDEDDDDGAGSKDISNTNKGLANWSAKPIGKIIKEITMRHTCSSNVTDCKNSGHVCYVDDNDGGIHIAMNSPSVLLWAQNIVRIILLKCIQD